MPIKINDGVEFEAKSPSPKSKEGADDDEFRIKIIDAQPSPRVEENIPEPTVPVEDPLGVLGDDNDLPVESAVKKVRLTDVVQ